MDRIQVRMKFEIESEKEKYTKKKNLENILVKEKQRVQNYAKKLHAC